MEPFSEKLINSLGLKEVVQHLKDEVRQIRRSKRLSSSAQNSDSDSDSEGSGEEAGSSGEGFDGSRDSEMEVNESLEEEDDDDSNDDGDWGASAAPPPRKRRRGRPV